MARRFPRLALDAGAKIIGVSDVSAALYNDKGLPVDKLIDYARQNRLLWNCPLGERISQRELLELEMQRRALRQD